MSELPPPKGNTFITWEQAALPADETAELPPLPEPKYRLPLAQAAQWQTALNCADREPFKPVLLEAQTVIAVHDAIERAVLAAVEAERERLAKVVEAQALESYATEAHMREARIHKLVMARAVRQGAPLGHKEYVAMLNEPETAAAIRKPQHDQNT